MNAHARPHSRPAAGTATGRVWDLADAISRAAGRKARRREVIDAYAAEGGNPNTASTQYYYWSQAAIASGRGTAPPPPESVQVRVDPSGRVALPPAILEALDLGPDGLLTARLVEGELRLVSPLVALRRIREIARTLGPSEGIVDEFIAERRREAERE